MMNPVSVHVENARTARTTRAPFSMSVTYCNYYFPQRIHIKHFPCARVCVCVRVHTAGLPSGGAAIAPVSFSISERKMPRAALQLLSTLSCPTALLLCCGFVLVRVCACVCACVRVCVRACVMAMHAVHAMCTTTCHYQADALVTEKYNLGRTQTS